MSPLLIYHKEVNTLEGSLNQVFELIGNIGFPIAISLYLLVRVEGKLENLTLSIYELARAVNGIDENSKSYKGSL